MRSDEPVGSARSILRRLFHLDAPAAGGTRAAAKAAPPAREPVGGSAFDGYRQPSAASMPTAAASPAASAAAAPAATPTTSAPPQAAHPVQVPAPPTPVAPAGVDPLTDADAPRPAARGERVVEAALARTYRPDIQIAPAQIEMVAATVRGRAPGCRLLVFGIGRDSAMWQAINRDGFTLFVEDNDRWIQVAKASDPGLNVLKIAYQGTTVKASLPVDRRLTAGIPVPDALKGEPWDVILIDAPLGYDDGCPGRSIPITWAEALLHPRTHVFVDDYERPVEKAWADALIAPRFAQTVVVERPGKQMLWCVGRSPQFDGWTCTNHSGQTSRLKCLLSTPALRLVMFHDSVDLIPDLVRLGLLDDSTQVFFSFSWRRDDAALRHLRNLLTRCDDATRERLRAQCHFLLNSAAELDAFRALLPDHRALHFNNAALLDPSKFTVAAGARPFLAVMNAKALAFKRHALTVQVPDRLFIAYDVNERDDGHTKTVDIGALGAREIRRNLPPSKVAEALGQAQVGLILSAEEGACYASLEYLLSGLPVVSTASLGGRDDFYDASNARIVEADPSAVAAAVAELAQAVADGRLDRAAIRQGALERRRAFLDRLAAYIQPLIDAAGLQLRAARWLDDAIAEGSKLQQHRNFWVKRLRPPGAAPEPGPGP